MQHQPFGVTVSDGTIRVLGDVDMSVSEQLLETLRACAEHQEHATIVVDLGEVTFMDSAGISALIRSHRSLEAMGRHLVVRNLTSPDGTQKILLEWPGDSSCGAGAPPASPDATAPDPAPPETAPVDGLKILSDVRDRYGLNIVTEAMDERGVDLVGATAVVCGGVVG